MSPTTTPPVIYRFESLLNLIFLCNLEAEYPDRVREYMRQAQKHLDAVIEIEGLRGARPANSSERKAS